MKLIFAGTPEFARVALEHLHSTGHEISLVLTQPDRAGGRGLQLRASAVKQFAQARGLALAQPRSLRLDGNYREDAAAARAAIEAVHADAMVVAAYGLILPQWVLDAPTKGGFNIHASLLPRWRGAAPIQRAIEAGDDETGVTIMQMDAGLDTGDLLMAHATPIVPSDTAATVHDRLSTLGARLMSLTLQKSDLGTLRPVPQTAQGVTYATKVEKAEAAIDWRQPADLIVRRVRAFNPAPGAHSRLQRQTFKIWAAAASTVAPGGNLDFGTIVAVEPEGIAVAAMNSIVVLKRLQRPGGKPLAVAEFLRGCDVRAGMAFDQHGD